MSGMDLSGRRANRGISVFWMILAMGVGVFALVAILLVGTNQAVEEVPGDQEAEVIATEGETVVVGSGNTEAAANDNDPTMLDDDVTVSGPQEEGDLSVEGVDANVQPAEPQGGEIVDTEANADEGVPAASEEQPAEGAAPAEAEAEATEEAAPAEAVTQEAPADEAEAPGDGEVVVDPDGTTAPVVPTPSGPEGRDDETIADELETTD
jgi:hypothetical protein